MNMRNYFAYRERKAARLQRKAELEDLTPQKKAEFEADRAARWQERKLAREKKRALAEIDKLQAQAEKESLREKREQERLIKKMDRECAAEEAAAHRQDLVERYGELGARYALRVEAKERKRDRRARLLREYTACIDSGDVARELTLYKKLHRRELTPVEREEQSRKRFINKQRSIQRRRAKRLGMTIEQYQLFITNTENRKRTAADFPDWSGV